MTAGRALYRLWPRRLRWRLVLGFALTVALLQAVLTGAERVLLENTLVSSLASNMETTVRTAVFDQFFGQEKKILAAATASKLRRGGTVGAASLLSDQNLRLLTVAVNTTQQLSTLANALALPDQPVAMLDLQRRVLTGSTGLTKAKVVANPRATAALKSLIIAATSPKAPLPFQKVVQVATPDGPYLVLLWRTEEPVLTVGQMDAIAALKVNPEALPGSIKAATLKSLHPSQLVVLIAHRLAGTQQTVATVTAISLGGSLAVIGCAALLSLLVVGRALRPLEAITRGAERLSRGDYDYRVALDAGDDEVGRLAAAFDRMAAAVGTAFARQRRFVADASHELRTPLTALRGYTDVLLLGLDEDRDTTERVLRAMQEDLGRMSRLVDDLLMLARLDGGVPLQRGPLLLADLLAAAADELAVISRGRHHIVIDPAPPEALLWADRDRLRQVLSNLIANACAYAPSGSTIQLRAVQRQSWAAIQVCDNGPGIPPSDLARLGERFYRGDTARSRSTGGTGLGLAIARAIVQAHGGTLTVESTLGKGTTVTIRLPLSPVSSAREQTAVPV